MDNFEDSHSVFFVRPPLDADVVGLLREEQAAIFRSDFSIHEDATLFLHELVKLGRRPATWRTFGYALAGWLDYLGALRRDYREAMQADLMGFRDAHGTNLSPTTGEPYALSTIALRMSAAIQFCQFLAGRGLYHGDILRGQMVQKMSRRPSVDRDMLAHTRSGLLVRPGGFALIPARQKSAAEIRPLTPDQVNALCCAAGAKGTRNRLIVDILWQTGLRVSELVALNALDFVACDDKKALFLRIYGKGRASGRKAERIGMKDEDGGKPRNVFFPSLVVADIQKYIGSERLKAVVMRKAAREESGLLVTGETSKSPPPGHRLSVRAIQSIIARASVEAGLIDNEHPNEDGEIVTRPSVSPHDLRHTFAVTRLAIAKLKDPKDKLGLVSQALWDIQTQLGHSSIATTREQYLSQANEWMQKVGLLSTTTLDLFKPEAL
jgi:integrase